MKKIIGLLFVLASFKALSQDSLKTKKINASTYAIVELKKAGAGASETAFIWYDDGTMEDMTGKLYTYTEPDFDLIAQRSLQFIKYMAQKHFYLISSSATSGDYANAFGGIRHYQYQLFFEKRDK